MMDNMSMSGNNNNNKDSQEHLIDQLKRENESFRKFLSHDFQTPVRHITTFLDLLLKDIQIPEDKKKYLNVINESSDRVKNMSRGILDVVNLKKEHLMTINFLSLINAFKNDLQEKFPGIQIECDTSDFEVHCHPLHLSRALKEIVENAMIATLERGIENNVKISIATIDNETVVYVKDKGIGLDEELSDEIYHLFKSFFEKKRNGIGLSFVDKFCALYGHRHGKYKNENGEGMTFFIALS